MDAASEQILAKLTNLASPRLGTFVHSASDEFFGAKERLIQDAEPIFVAGKYDANGKWMDGWETRRRRGEGHDWCIVALGVAGTISAVEIDTRHFTGNFPPGASLEGCGDRELTASSRWQVLLSPSPLGPNERHVFPVVAGEPMRWLRLSIFPDGGVARLRAYGRPVVDPSDLESGDLELTALRHGGRILGFSDAHYGNPSVILSEGRGRDMGDGWETRRRREPGFDWIVIALGLAGEVTRVEVDTAHFKGNFPDTVSIQAARQASAPDDAIVCQAMFWPDLLSPQAMRADAVHAFGPEVLRRLGPVTHLRLNIHPDGGISRVRAFGRPLP